MFEAKVLESHYERLYGTVELSDSQSSSEDSESELHSVPARSKEVELKGSLQDGHQSLHRQHKDFLERQLQNAEKYKEKMNKLPRAVSSKRSLEDVTTTENCVVKRFSVDTASEERSDTRGPRTVSNEEKNRRRKEKKRKAK